MRTHDYLCLERYDPARNMARYYALSIQPNLFGGWSLLREWGRIGSPGSVSIDLCESMGEAYKALEKKLEEKKKRGYSCVVARAGDIP